MSEALKQPDFPPLPTEATIPDNVVPLVPKKKFHRFSFHGTGGEYFAIWIVNIFLSILTLGIFSAWGKVRAKKFFYHNTSFQGHHFEYHGNPISILKGRIIAFTIFAAYVFGPQAHPIFNIAGVALFAAAIPFFFAKALKFNAAVSSYRNIRFQFKGSVKEAYRIYFEMFMLPIVCAVLSGAITYMTVTKQIPMGYYTLTMTANLLLSIIPVLYYALRANHILKSILNFVYCNLYYGNRQVDFFAEKEEIKEAIKKPYLIYVAKWLGIIVALVGAGVVFSPILFALQFVLFAGFACISLKLPYLITDYVWSNMVFEGAKSKSNLEWKKYITIGFGNMFLTALSFGLYYPFGKVKMLKYKLQARHMETIDFESILADDQQEISAVGDEFDDAFDLDISIGL